MTPLQLLLARSCGLLFILTVSACAFVEDPMAKAMRKVTPYRTEVVQGNFVSKEQVQALRLIGQANFPRNLFTQVENDAADLTFQMTRNIKVDSELMKRLQKALGSTDTVELVTVIAAYNMVSRFLIALDVNPEDHPPA